MFAVGKGPLVTSMITIFFLIYFSSEKNTYRKIGVPICPPTRQFSVGDVYVRDLVFGYLHLYARTLL
jgi:hypothetical protein